MARLAEIDSAPSKALQITVLTCARTSETLGMTFDEIDFDNAIWTIPASRMKMDREHTVPLSDQALAILRRQHDERGSNPHVFPGRPTRGLSNMSLAMLLRRMKVDATVHGFRASARSWMADQGVEFSLAEAALAHTVGNAVVQAYQRSSICSNGVDRVLASWADFVTGEAVDNVAPLPGGRHDAHHDHPRRHRRRAGRRPDAHLRDLVPRLPHLPRAERLSLDRMGPGRDGVRRGQSRQPLVDEPMAGPRDNDD